MQIGLTSNRNPYFMRIVMPRSTSLALAMSGCSVFLCTHRVVVCQTALKSLRRVCTSCGQDIGKIVRGPKNGGRADQSLRNDKLPCALQLVPWLWIFVANLAGLSNRRISFSSTRLLIEGTRQIRWGILLHVCEASASR